MSSAYLLDSNVLSEPVRPTPSELLVGRIRANLDRIAVPAPVWHELLFGCQRLPGSRRRTALQEYLESGVRAVFPILPYDEAAATWHAQERARLSKLGRPPAFVDSQIAAIAFTRGLVLVTANTRDFNDFNGLKLADWSAPAGAAPTSTSAGRGR